MGTRALSLGVVFGLASLASSAHAQGWYVGIQGGMTFAQDADNEANGVTITTSQDTGFNIGGVGGYDFGNSFRAEGEVVYRKNDVDELDLSDLGLGVNTLDGTGDVSALSFMANGFYDFDVSWPVKPYVGAGIGVASVSLNDVGATAGGLTVELADDDDTVFAYQLGAGLSYPLTPSATISVDYRYFATSDPTFKDVDGDKFDSEFKSHNIGVRLLFRF